MTSSNDLMTNLGKHTKSQPKWILFICSINSYTSNHFFLSVVFFVVFFGIVIFHVLLLYVCYIVYVIQSLNHLPQPGDHTVDIASHLCIYSTVLTEHTWNAYISSTQWMTSCGGK